jgi:hypothetical protein
VKTFAAWLEEALQVEPTGPATPATTLSEQPALEGFERLLSALPRLAPSRVAQAPWAGELGLTLPCDIDAVKHAFRRLAFRTHPDRPGGSHAAFLRAQELLEEALAWLRDSRSEAPRTPRAYSRTARATTGAVCAVYA